MEGRMLGEEVADCLEGRGGEDGGVLKIRY